MKTFYRSFNGFSTVLTFANVIVLYPTGDSESSIEMRYEDENIWLTQRMMAVLYDVSIPAINQHLKKIFEDEELQESSTIKKYLIVQKRVK